MEKHISDKIITSFVMRKILKMSEPLISILKVIETDPENDVISLYNIMTGLPETVTLEEYLEYYRPINEKNLEKEFAFVYEAHLDPNECIMFEFEEEEK